MTTGIKTEWWRRDEFLPADELPGILRRMEKRHTADIGRTEETIVFEPRTLRAVPMNASTRITASHPNLTPKQCEQCSMTFNPRTPTHRFCCQSCAAKAQNRRFRAKAAMGETA